VLFTIPSRYLCTIGRQGVFSLIRWSGQIHTELHVLRATWDDPKMRKRFRLRGCHALWPSFPEGSPTHFSLFAGSHYPRKTSLPGLGCSAFARHYLRNHIRFLFLRLLRCFTSARSPHRTMHSSGDTRSCLRVGCPIRRSAADNACLRLTAAYRSLLRPSSPLGAKASTISP
jgi:hypothetical protein